MIYTLTLNPSIDCVYSLDVFEKGVINRSVYEEYIPAGKGINVSVTLQALGVKSVCLGFIAGFTGEYLEEYLTGKGIACGFTRLASGITRINPKLRYGGETDINGAGPMVGEADITALEKSLDVVKSGDVVLFCGSAPKGVGRDIYARLIKSLSGRDVRIIVDAEGELLTNTFPFRPFLIKPNYDELCGVAGRKFESRAEITDFCKKLTADGDVSNVLCSLGEKGAVLVTDGGRVFSAKAPKVEMKSTTGAGDRMLAGFLASYLSHSDFSEALNFSCICGGGLKVTVSTEPQY